MRRGNEAYNLDNSWIACGMKRVSHPFTDKGGFFVAISQFGSSLSYNFIMAFMPFYILKIIDSGQKLDLFFPSMVRFLRDQNA